MVAAWIDRYDDAIDECKKLLLIFRELVKSCKENDIELICVTSPITPTVVKTLGMDTVHDTTLAFRRCNMDLSIMISIQCMRAVFQEMTCNYSD